MDSPVKHPLQAEVAAYIKKKQLFGHRDKIILAVSGGLDSSVLCHLLNSLGYAFEIAHMNFQLRGEESERDEQFVRQLADHYRARIHVKKVNAKEYATLHKQSLQEAARELRYQWFDEICRNGMFTAPPNDPVIQVKERGYEKPVIRTVLVTAHHLDDNIETVLMHFFQGTGLAGMRGMLPATDRVVRPLLFVSREALEDYAKAFSISWVEDSSNSETKYSRNFMRHEIIPVIEKLYPSFRSSFPEQLERFRDIEDFTRHQFTILQKKLCVEKGDELHIPVLKLRHTPGARTLLHAILTPRGFSPAQLGDILRLMDAENGKQVFSSTHRILRNRAWLIIAPRETVQPDFLIIDALPATLSLEGKSVSFDRILDMPSIDALKDADCHYLDSRNIRFPLIIRKWRKADYFYPLGMRKKKKLARFFIDEKFSALDKEKQWILESDGRILAVLGKRLDDRFKLQSSTQEIFRVRFY